jgi:hypothetical protein
VTRVLDAEVMLASLGACANCLEGSTALRGLISKDPVALANTAIARGEAKFLGVAGYSITVPGIDTPKCTALPNWVSIIEGTSDTSCDRNAQQAAADFAQRYNVVIKTHLDANRINYERCAL